MRVVVEKAPSVQGTPGTAAYLAGTGGTSSSEHQGRQGGGMWWVGDGAGVSPGQSALSGLFWAPAERGAAKSYVYFLSHLFVAFIP
jgi:hypothetical protein